MSLYKNVDQSTCKEDEDGQMTTLANFWAEIVEETRTIDGINNTTVLTIHGLQTGGPPKNGVLPKPIQMPEVRIDSKDFASFAWVLQAWGSRAVIFPETGVKEDLRTCIQLNSKPTIKEIYGTMGWQQDAKGNKMYLHAAGAIKDDGNDGRVTVVLPPELARFDLTTGQPGCDPHEAFHASLDLMKLGPPEVMWPLWSAVYAPILGPCDFGIHLAGRSGTFKSEITSLFQSHYGAGMDARHLPANWSSTGNALEALAYFAKNAMLVIDDFVPQGTSNQVKQLQANADRVIRGQGNQQGRARLSDAAAFRSAYYPRGLILSTGEDTMEGHSVRARMLILEMSPGDTDVKSLTTSQQARTKMPVCLTEFIKDACDTVAPGIGKADLLTPELQDRVNEVRDLLIEIGHTRTPPMLARLIATAETVLQWAAERGFLTNAERDELSDQARDGIIKAGMKQQTYLESADPVQVFMQAIRNAMMSQKAHVRSMSGGVPLHAETLGWTQVTVSGEQPKYKAGGPTVGWIDWDHEDGATMYLEADLAWAAAKKEAGNDLAITKMTMWKRMKDAGLIAQTDGARQRNTIRVYADGHTRNVIALRASDFNQTQEENDNGQSDEQPREDDPFTIADVEAERPAAGAKRKARDNGTTAGG